MSLSMLFWWIYQLSPGAILFLLLLCTLVFFVLHRRLEGCRWRRSFLAAVLMIWLAAAIYATLLNRGGGTVGEFQMLPFHSYREVRETGNREILRSNFMNVVLFYPAGLLFAAILPKRWRAPITLTVFVLFSLSIEIAQHAMFLGRGELDDVLHNTLGAACGCLAFSLGRRLITEDRNDHSQPDDL